jgi:hypothetical protein
LPISPANPGFHSASIDEVARKAAKLKNKKGNPIKLQSKLLAVIADPDDEQGVYVAEAAGCVRRVGIDVCEMFFL